MTTIKDHWALAPTVWERQGDYLRAQRRMSDLPPVDPSLPALRVHVVRNHPVEMTMRIAQRLAGYLGLTLTPSYSAYDDSFAFTGESPDADVTLVWPDWTRIHPDQRMDVLTRLTSRRDGRPAGMVIESVPEGVNAADAHFAETIESIARQAGMSVIRLPVVSHESVSDERMSSMVGSDRPLDWHFAAAEVVGIGWVGSVLLPPLKLLALDLDNTLYSGALGEDGPQGIRFSPEHLRLLEQVDRMQAKGVLVVVVTKNDARDIPSLVQAWPSTGFQLSSAARVLASWDSKADQLQALAAELGFDARSVMFADDNPGELAAVSTRLPGLWPVLAIDPTQAAGLLALQAGRLTTSDTTGGARTADLQAAAARQAAEAQAGTLADLHESLRTTIAVRRAGLDDTARAADLLARTNQFNLAMARLPERDVIDRLTAPGGGVAIVQVRDRLADSGTVAVGIGRRTTDAIEFEEVALSCRVLGRGLESLIILSLAQAVAGDDEMRDLDFVVRRGPRNDPARTWLSGLVGTEIVEDGTYRVPLAALIEDAAAVRSGVTVMEGEGSDGTVD